ISPDPRARRILRDLESLGCDSEATDVAVTEVGRVHETIVRRNAQPAQLRGDTDAGVDFDERPHIELALGIDSRHGASIADGVSNDEGIRTIMEKREVERRAGLSVLEAGHPERAIF